MKENQHVEWKETWRDEYLRWVCAFANAEGGVLEIGRNNRGVVVGVPNAARLLEEIPNKVRDILGIRVAVRNLSLAASPSSAPTGSLPGGAGRSAGRSARRNAGRRWVAAPVEIPEKFTVRLAMHPAMGLARPAPAIGKSAGAVRRTNAGTVSINRVAHPRLASNRAPW